MSTPNEWWGGLPEAVKDRLSADPQAPVPADLWEQVTMAGSVDVDWSEIKPGPDGYHLPEKLAAFVERRTVRLVAD